MPKERTIKFRLKVPIIAENHILIDLLSKPLVQLEVPKGPLKEVDVEEELNRYSQLKDKLKKTCERLLIKRLKHVKIDEAREYLNIENIEKKLNEINKKLDEIYNNIVLYLDQIEETDISKLTQKIIAKNKDIAKEFYPEACKIYTALNALEKITSIKRYIRRHENWSVIEGWILKRNKEKILEILDKIQKELNISIETKFWEKPSEIKDAPVQLSASKIFSPFVSIVRSMGIPAGYEPDPTYILAAFWIIMFGFMFPDFGQALIIILLALYLRKKKEFLGFSAKKLSTLLLWCGVAAAITGLLFGEIFMLEIPAFLGFFGIHTETSSLLELLFGVHINWKNPAWVILMLKISILFGILQLLIGIILGIMVNIQKGEKIAVIFGVKGLAGVIMFISILMLGISFLITERDTFRVILTLILYGILQQNCDQLSRGLHEIFEHADIGGPILGILLSTFMILLLPKFEKELSFSEAIGELIDTIISFIANILSYIRLAGFALAHIIFAMVLTEILTHAYPLWLQILIPPLFNFISVTLEFLVVGIQSTRLGLYEFMTKFYEGAGKIFIPMHIKLY